MPGPNNIKDLCADLVAKGFRVMKTKNGHWKVTNPRTGRKCQIASTPGDYRSIKNAITRLKKIGYVPTCK